MRSPHLIESSTILLMQKILSLNLRKIGPQSLRRIVWIIMGIPKFPLGMLELSELAPKVLIERLRIQELKALTHRKSVPRTVVRGQSKSIVSFLFYLNKF